MIVMTDTKPQGKVAWEIAEQILRSERRAMSAAEIAGLAVAYSTSAIKMGIESHPAVFVRIGERPRKAIGGRPEIVWDLASRVAADAVESGVPLTGHLRMDHVSATEPVVAHEPLVAAVEPAPKAEEAEHDPRCPYSDAPEVPVGETGCLCALLATDPTKAIVGVRFAAPSLTLADFPALAAMVERRHKLEQAAELLIDAGQETLANAAMAALEVTGVEAEILRLIEAVFGRGAGG